MTSDNLVGYDAGYRPQSEIWLWIDSEYVSYFYFSPQNATSWTMPQLSGKWITSGFSVADDDYIDAATGIWIKTTDPSEVIFKGQVYSETNATVNVEAGLNPISNPFPVEWDIQNFKTLNLTGYDAGYRPQSEIWLWVDGEYVSYFYFSEQNATTWSMPQLSGKWITSGFSPASATVDVGKGFWIKTISDASLVFTR